MLFVEYVLTLLIIVQQTFLGSLLTDPYAGICPMICLTDSNVLFLIVIFSS
jgi:hypothetical protein